MALHPAITTLSGFVWERFREGLCHKGPSAVMWERFREVSRHIRPSAQRLPVR